MSFPLPTLLVQNIEKLNAESELIPSERRTQLDALRDYIYTEKAANKTVQITVICTHNSRRSHIGQLWLEAAARYQGWQGFESYSGGTEATAFNPQAVAALQQLGFPIQQITEGNNPIYHCQWDPKHPARDLFSKKYSSFPNPQKDFAAILVCEEAAEACPIVSGAKSRFPIAYQDPKRYDGQPDAARYYLDCARQIGREMLYTLTPRP